MAWGLKNWRNCILSANRKTKEKLIKFASYTVQYHSHCSGLTILQLVLRTTLKFVCLKMKSCGSLVQEKKMGAEKPGEQKKKKTLKKCRTENNGQANYIHAVLTVISVMHQFFSAQNHMHRYYSGLTISQLVPRTTLTFCCLKITYAAPVFREKSDLKRV